ncbi:SDR family NAD(P)-dependent oxidoreductase [Alkalicoccobacillus porphyridii]|uniref:SDR family oxidoreductase n=1 Tax=Alkalicoccobacillus porphyridii TaxID=2597270 RepID=A0A553ZX57_9BACI|nr:SDR family oxidoreductase [Alkalicoccobacillus porphyridii]TSB45926.1 SDR family oxidoreductase [Alkalicoccobacillus porphyridii]
MTKSQLDRTALVTGASSGIGFELTKSLLKEGWQVAVIIRSDFVEKTEEIEKALSFGNLRVYHADLTDFNELKSVLDQIKEHEHHLDVIFNNAGGSFSSLLFSKQHRELHYELQTIVPYIIYKELNELLTKGNKKTVIQTTTEAFRFLKEFDLDYIHKPLTFKKLMGPYAASKLALSLWTKEVATTGDSNDIQILSVDPGSNNTTRKGKDSGLPFPIHLIMRFFYPHPSKGANRLLKAAIHAHDYDNGAYLTKEASGGLPWVETSARVLQMVDTVYREEFLKLSNKRSKSNES